jgi:hypothetical protein
MGQTAIKNYKKLYSQTGGDPSLATRVTTLENNEYKITYFAEISDSTGTITIPTGATILLDQLQGGVDAYVCTIQNGQPTGNFPQTALGVTVDVTSFDALGNYTLSGTPSSYPVALIYILKIKAKDYSNLDITKILDLEDVGVSAVNLIREEFTYVSGTQDFTLINVASAVYTVFVNGQELRESQYSFSATTLTIIDTLEVDDRIDIIYSNTTPGINPSYTKVESDALLALKENAFAKNTGFNLPLGTTAGTVKEGDKGVTVIYRDFAKGAALTGTTAITLINSALIPANTIAVNDEVEIKTRAIRDILTGTSTHYLYYNTTNSLSGAALMATQSAAARQYAIQRPIWVRSASESVTVNSGLTISGGDALASTVNVTWSSLNIDWTADVYIIQAFANAAIGNTTESEGLIITRARL